MKILVSGASGFLGRHIVAQAQHQHDVECIVRNQSPHLGHLPQHQWSRVLDTESQDEHPLTDTEVVIHLAAKAHVLKKQSSSALASYREVNAQLTLKLAKQAERSGVRRFIFLSTIGVHGHSTTGTAISERSPEAPLTDYALSKLEAEQELHELAAITEMEICIIRPPLVYAADAPGNFGRLLKLAKSGVPLPFGNICNKRNMVATENLIDFVMLCIKHPQAANETFVIADNEAVSLAEIIQHLRSGMGIGPRLLPVSSRLLEAATSMLGKRAIYEQLCGDLEVCNGKAREILGWRPVVTAQDALTKTGKTYKELLK